MLEKEKEVQGVAVYAEWTKPDALLQIIITPDGYTESDEFVQASMYRRIITTENPKKQWRASPLGFDKHDEYNATLPLLDADKASYVETRMSKTTQWFDKMLIGGWDIVKEPLLIEVSKKDMDDIRLGKTPSKFMYRVDLVRKALDFPHPLKNEEE
jgi:hypothetical protein